MSVRPDERGEKDARDGETDEARSETGDHLQPKDKGEEITAPASSNNVSDAVRQL